MASMNEEQPHVVLRQQKQAPGGSGARA